MKNKNNIKKYVVNQISHDNKYEDDYVAKCMGAFGAWQAMICLLVSVTRIIAGWHIITIVYLTPNTDFVCTEFENETDLDVARNICYDECVKYSYDNTIFEMTLTSEFELICGRSWMASFTQTMLMFGLFIGVNLFGWISDRFGRRISLTLSVAVPVLFSIVSPFAPDYWTFTFFRFFIGMGCGGIFAVSIVIIVEIIGPQYREIGGGLGIIIDGFSQASLVIFASYSTTWRMFLLSLGLISTLIIIVTLLFLSETPRWLMANKQTEKALKLMTKVAKFNKLGTENIKRNVEKAIKEMEEKHKSKTTTAPGFSDLFKTKELTLITIFSTIVWCVAGACFFGINQYVTLLGSNVHIIVLASGLIQVPANLTASMLNKYCGRKTSSFSFAVTTGIVMGILSFIPDGDWAATFAVAGLFSSSALFVVLIVQVTELFPTVLRSKAYGFNSGGSKLAAMIAPFVVIIKPHWISSLIFSITALIGAGFSLLLPETKGITLKDTTMSKEAVA